MSPSLETFHSSYLEIFMKTNIESISTTKKKITVDITSEEVNACFDKAYKSVGKKANLKGFRKGKVPSAVLEKYYASDISVEALNQAINDSYPKALQEHAVHPINDPHFDLNPLTRGEAYSFSAEIEVIPPFEIKDYKGVTLQKREAVADDAEVEKSLKNIQESKAQLGPIAEDAVLEKGIMAQLTIDGTIDGKTFNGSTTKGYVVEVGADRLFADFEKAILGMKKGETREFEVTLPEHVFEEAVRGKKAHFKVLVESLHSKVLLPLDDEFAKDLGQETMVALKEAIKADILKRKENANKNEYANQLIEKIVSEYNFDLPEGLVNHQIEHSSQAKKEDIEKRLRTELVFQKIAETEKVAVDPSDIENRLREIAVMTGKPIAEVHQNYRQQDRIRQLWLQLRFEKTVNLLIEQAKFE